MNYAKFGSGDKTMLIIPGLSLKPVTGDVKLIAKAYELFSNDFNVYLFDAREDISEGYSIEDMANDTLEKIDELGLSDIYLYGVSMGGMVCQYIVYKRPELVKKLVLCSTVSKVEENEAIKSWKNCIDNQDVNKLVDSFMYYIYSKEFYDKYVAMFIKMNEDLSLEALNKVGIRIDAVSNFDLSDEDKNNKVPTLVIGSKMDKVFDTKSIKQLADDMNGTYYLYDEYSHAVYDECEDIKDRIYKFFMD